jgi:hypothetical protein
MDKNTKISSSIVKIYLYLTVELITICSLFNYLDEKLVGTLTVLLTFLFVFLSMREVKKMDQTSGNP